MNTDSASLQRALRPQTTPTMYFIGVTTEQSSIMKIFPQWASIFGIDAQLLGYDAPLHAPAQVYRDIVLHIKNDPLSKGALVTTHKIDLLDATRDLFDYLDPYAQLCGEISCIAKRDDGSLHGYAKDPITSGLSWRDFVPSGYFQTHPSAEVLCLGGGGAAVAITVYVADLDDADRPPKFTVIEISPKRLEQLRSLHEQMTTPIHFEYLENADPQYNDAHVMSLPPGSLVINATGMGKDLPGSPITDNCVFPQDGLVWELNYRGGLDFMQQALRQAEQRRLNVTDGWVYFLHGWTQVIAEVFQLELTTERFAQLEQAARAFR